VKLVSKFFSYLIIMAVRAYQVVLSPLFRGCCRFTPSCSRYCIEAVQIHGPLRGSFLTIKRLLKCRPYGPSGYDPVPPRKVKNG
jgi:putative membrane protein insertion efficiency factor